MAKQQVAEQESLGEAMNKTELFFEENGRKIAGIFLGLLCVAALIFGYRALVTLPRALHQIVDSSHHDDTVRSRIDLETNIHIIAALHPFRLRADSLVKHTHELLILIVSVVD